ncbi:fatty acid oxidation complex subunit alpha FadJ, partial [Candidatus Saccharibacteria bacterium]|nr:fatty acid oxidation complex subunit alpha FadJ [Candidatus Saccharibacteria bacterium]NIV04192.1 fatty acid oxidation complex subunit alpha FadJ [Calditrichia bacterium]NIV72631.1 fatty acid oxidation complex subunit alpha FadJ [Calditrichia bacterium]NIV99766.1 fatty acid oxidation complex subunit alpha FadJ [Candidatus Saccharibacteria bacterium]NIW80129.1 fatty acid oxidation complex subunit alpha FadJ [Calditrichia bacterium]
EAKAFEELARSSETQELIQLFFNMNSRKKNPLQEKARLIKKISVLGAGFMGAGIANISALHNIQVLLKDVSVEAINDGQKKVWDDLDKKVKKRAL